MKLFYLSKENLNDKVFIHDFAFHFDKKTKAIILHDLFGTKAEDTYFVSKRLSAVLSESMIVNFPVSGDQKNLISGNRELPVVRTELIQKSFETVSVFITNRLIAGKENEAADLIPLLSILKKEFLVNEILFFPANSRSPIALSPVNIQGREDVEKTLSVYEEERKVIELAFEMRPSRIVSPATMNL